MTSPGQRANQTRDNLTCVGHYWTEGPTHNTCTKKSPGSRCVVTGGIKAGPSPLITSRKLFGVCEASVSRNLLLKGDTLITKGFLIFQNVTFKAIALTSCTIQKNCISSFENLQLFHVFCVKRGKTLWTLFLRKMTLTPRLLNTVPQQGYYYQQTKVKNFFIRSNISKQIN